MCGRLGWRQTNSKEERKGIQGDDGGTGFEKTSRAGAPPWINITGDPSVRLA